MASSAEGCSGSSSSSVSSSFNISKTDDEYPLFSALSTAATLVEEIRDLILTLSVEDTECECIDDPSPEADAGCSR
jgi:hypothetical protein